MGWRDGELEDDAGELVERVGNWVRGNGFFTDDENEGWEEYQEREAAEAGEEDWQALAESGYEDTALGWVEPRGSSVGVEAGLGGASSLGESDDWMEDELEDLAF